MWHYAEPFENAKQNMDYHHKLQTNTVEIKLIHRETQWSSSSIKVYWLHYLATEIFREENLIRSIFSTIH